MRTRRIGSLAIALVLLTAPLLWGAAVEVRLKLPQKARLDLQGRRTLTIAPFLVVTQEGQERMRSRNIDIQAEFERYLTKTLRRQTDLKLIEAPAVD
jgi:hypothetical protein